MEAIRNIQDHSPESTIVVEMNDVKKSFGSHQVLKSVSMKLAKEENLVVLGKSGTGKSVLIKCMVGLIEPDDGELLMFGKNILSAGRDEISEIRGKTGFLFQSGALYDSMTVRENLEYPLRRKMSKATEEEIDTMVKEVLENVGLSETVNKMPSELSGGMKKRISLARTLILKPELVLYDEPTTGLDPITSQEISELILEIRKKYKTSSVIITHDIKCAKLTADRIMILHEGKFIAEGTYDQLSSSSDKNINSFFR